MIRTQTFMLQINETSDDGIGGMMSSWANYVAVDGYLDMLSGTDQTTIQKAIVEQSTHILILPLYNGQITDSMRIVDAVGRTYAITYVDDPGGQHHHTEIYLNYGGVEA